MLLNSCLIEPKPFVYRHSERLGMIHFGFEPCFFLLPRHEAFGMALSGANIGHSGKRSAVFTQRKTRKSPIFTLKWAQLFPFFPPSFFCQVLR